MKRPRYYGEKRPVEGEIVATLRAKGSGLKLSEHWSRALRLNEIHEIMVSNEEVSPGEDLRSFTAMAFFEVTQGGHTVVGDVARIEGVELGILAGYEMNHMPNHMNLVFTTRADDYPVPRIGQKIVVS